MLLLIPMMFAPFRTLLQCREKIDFGNSVKISLLTYTMGNEMSGKGEMKSRKSTYFFSLFFIDILNKIAGLALKSELDSWLSCYFIATPSILGGKCFI